MSNPSQIDQVTAKVALLLARYENVQRVNALLSAQVETLSKERDSLTVRLKASRARVEVLLQRLPDTASDDTKKGKS